MIRTTIERICEGQPEQLAPCILNMLYYQCRYDEPLEAFMLHVTRSSFVPRAKRIYYMLLDVIDPIDIPTHGYENRRSTKRRREDRPESHRVGGVCPSDGGAFSRPRKTPRRSEGSTHGSS